ncbi:hypothetical protein [Roseibium salinum]|uniref:DUF2933 family protein n=1 Tax=Roseibium salinum TaxID=1604349 RepID=A0ABT3R9Q3_9HYPH|nr:hypothetical protein [Roseibium sp. DSM 29163]MCX2725735.1 hypothetical protein [Roseibium sp. DSM 29163]
MSLHESTTPIRASVPDIQPDRTTGPAIRKPVTGHNLFMMACCALMVVGTGILIASAPAGQSLADTLLLAVPMLGCVGLHFVMHRFMGKSCHSHTKQDQKND